MKKSNEISRFVANKGRDEMNMPGIVAMRGAVATVAWCVCVFACKCLAASAAVDISVGRQLFVDDFLVESAGGVVRRWNRPVKEDAPVVWPGGSAAPKTVDGSSGAKAGEKVNLTCATDGGLWWDPTKQRFRLWYQADWLGDICYAESGDGISWEKRGWTPEKTSFSWQTKSIE